MPRYLISFDDGSMNHIPEEDWPMVAKRRTRWSGRHLGHIVRPEGRSREARVVKTARVDAVCRSRLTDSNLRRSGTVG